MPILFTAARSASRPPTSAERFLGSGFAAVWLLLWSLITLAFDGILVVMVAQTMLAWSYPSVPGTITHSEIRREIAAEGDAFHADLKYQYVVNGQDFIGERRSFFNMSWNSSRAASRIIRSMPVGQQVEVFYNPRDPHDAALNRSLDGSPLFLALFLMPFNLVMVGGWRWTVRSFRGVRDLPMRREEERWVVRRAHGNPFVVALFVAGAISFVSAFIIGFGEWTASVGVTSGVWLFLIGMSLLAYWHTRSTVLSEPPVLIADNTLRTVTWPARGDDGFELTIPAIQIRAVELDEIRTHDHEGDTVPDYSVRLAFIGND
ncbi:MAG TPA: DUF3592 domain-containing protein, partial [Planctomycetaceae bacterium]|nr:DUF3592 domain-containing protein [Planctomycetaceae bacterium]